MDMKVVKIKNKIEYNSLFGAGLISAAIPKNTKEYTKALDLRGCHGFKYEGFIDGKEVKGKIVVEDSYCFLAQDLLNGTSCNNKLGYKYSWIIQGPGVGISHGSVIITKIVGVEYKIGFKYGNKRVSS
jgi:hypothetical protein